MKNSKSKASQRLLNTNTSNLLQILADIQIVRTTENTVVDSNKFTKPSKKYWKCLSYQKLK